MNTPFQSEDIIKRLLEDLNFDRDNMTLTSQLIVKTLSSIDKLQSLSTVNENVNFLDRSIKQGVIFELDENVNNVIGGLLNKKFCDKDGISKFQSDVYNSLMTMEVKTLKKEIEYLNSIAAKKRRLLRSITTEDMFICVKYLDSKNAFDTLKSGYQ